LSGPTRGTPRLNDAFRVEDTKAAQGEIQISNGLLKQVTKEKKNVNASS